MIVQLKAFWAKLNSDVGDLWQNSRSFLIIFGVLIIFLKFRDIALNLLISGAQRIFNNATNQSGADQKQENQDNQNADSLIDNAGKFQTISRQ
jgi:hypothetical protein